jgi:hypothetical protein
MSFSRAATLTSTSILLFASAALIAVGCGSTGTTPAGTGGSVGTGGSGGHATGGKTGSGGLTGSGGAGGAAPIFPTCTPVTADMANILDFSVVAAGAAQAQFGDFFSTFSGGTFQYPTADATVTPPAIGLTSDFTGLNWHITGTVANYSGFGLYLFCKSNVSAFTGIQFDIAGTFAANGVGDGGAPPARVTMGIATPPDDLNSALSGTVNWGTCLANCTDPTHSVSLSATTTTMTLPWAMFAGGAPVGLADPTQITSIYFTLPWSGTSAQYTVDITLDNIMFTGGPPSDAATSTPDAGVDTAAPPASDAAAD